MAREKREDLPFQAVSCAHAVTGLVRVSSLLLCSFDPVSRRTTHTHMT